MASPTSSEFSNVIDWTEAMEQCGGGARSISTIVGTYHLDQVSGIYYFCRVGRGFADRIFPALIILPIISDF